MKTLKRQTLKKGKANMPINLDFGPEATSGGLPDEGTYDVICSGCEYLEAKAEGKYPQLKWEFKISEGKYAETAFPISYWTSLSPNARYYLQQFLEALTRKAWDQDNMTIDPKDMPGRTAMAVIVHKPYTDKKTNQEKIGLSIETLLPADSNGDTPGYRSFG